MRQIEVEQTLKAGLPGMAGHRRYSRERDAEQKQMAGEQPTCACPDALDYLGEPRGLQERAEALVRQKSRDEDEPFRSGNKSKWLITVVTRLCRQVCHCHPEQHQPPKRIQLPLTLRGTLNRARRFRTLVRTRCQIRSGLSRSASYVEINGSGCHSLLSILGCLP